MSPKFLLKEDMVIKIDVAGTKKEIRLFDKGKVFEANEKGEYILESMAGTSILTEDSMRTQTDPYTGEILFDVIEDKKPEQKLEFVIEEVPEDDDNQEKRWRIQLDVTTTRKKLKEIETFMNENIKKLL